MTVFLLIVIVWLLVGFLMACWSPRSFWEDALMFSLWPAWTLLLGAMWLSEELGEVVAAIRKRLRREGDRL